MAGVAEVAVATWTVAIGVDFSNGGSPEEIHEEVVFGCAGCWGMVAGVVLLEGEVWVRGLRR
jgi:hypothetical protein